VTDSPDVLDRLEKLVNTNMHSDAQEEASALITELRAARAVSQEASGLRAEAPLIPSHVIEAHRQTYLKALEAVELVANIIAKDAGAETRNVHQFYAQAVAKLRDGVTPERPAPPADEVAGLRAVRDASAEVLLAWHGSHASTRLDVELSEMQKAFDASLKGER
jgi:hypothetical protein